MPLTRRSFVAGSGAASAMLALPCAPRAAGPEPSDVPEIHAFPLGLGTLTAMRLPASGLDPAWSGQGRQAAANGANAFVYRDGSRTVLVDAGGPARDEGQGILAALDAAGISGMLVDTILITHLHPDNIGGLLDEGEAVFRFAEIHVHAGEVAYWTGAEGEEQAPDEDRPLFAMARRALDAYGGRVKTFATESDVTPGFRAIPLPGHTPGHSGFLFGERAPTLVWGDVAHGADEQSDLGPEEAARTRQRVLERSADEGLAVAGTHIAFPGVGRVADAEDGPHLEIGADAFGEQACASGPGACEAD